MPKSKVNGKNHKQAWVAGGSIAGLVFGAVLGGWAHGHPADWLTALIDAVAPIGVMWGNALRLVVLPLIVAQLLYALVTARNTADVGRIGGLSFVVFAVMLVAGGLLTAAAMRVILPWIHFAPDALAAFRGAVPDAAPPAVAPAAGMGTWLIGLIPNNAVRAASQDNLVGVLIFTLAFGCAAAQLPAERRALVGELSRATAETMMIVVGWIIWVMPVAVFAIALSTAGRSGSGALELLGLFVVLVCAVMLVWTVLLYPIATLGGVSIRRFANAVAPVQLVAMTTRSSIASLPALIDGAQNRLGLRSDVSSVVSTLAVSTFKLSHPISSPVQFMFVAYIYGVELSATQLIFYVLSIVVLSFAAVGIPNGGAMMRAAPLYVAAGVPLEGYLLTEAVETIPDVFKTLLNVTGDMTAAAIVNRLCSQKAQSVTAATIDPLHAVHQDG